MKKMIRIFAAVMLLAVVAISVVGCVGDSETVDNSAEDVQKGDGADNELGNYAVDIKSARLAENYEGNPVVIITYGFTNDDDEATSFSLAFDDTVYQNGIECEHEYFLADDADYNSDNQSKDIQKGASLDVEVAYALNDTTSPVNVEIAELFSFDEKKITKTFNLQ